MVSGSDHYLGDLTDRRRSPTCTSCNAFMAAVHDADQPLTVTGVRGRAAATTAATSTRQCDPTAVELKTRLCVAQGNRLINYYLFAGGINPPLDEPVGDGNDRISFTGERHGMAAPVGPEGLHGLDVRRRPRGRRGRHRAEPWLARWTRSTTTWRSASCPTTT